jgi:flavin reductase (DIM6/NTAB) family NADH-FMN oxidoreductase RutF
MTGVTIHGTDPFATPDDARSPLRRLRARMPATVTLWTAYGRDGRPAGLTVSSTLVADGEPGLLLGLVDDESEVYPALLATRRFAVTVLGAGDDQLADRFAGLLPAPGGLFTDAGWERTDYGPVRAAGHAWAGCTMSSAARVGYGMLVQATVDRVELGDVDRSALVRYRGRYARGIG